ncbi:hypothetical protein PENTCL1PPCAC_24907, partial [Pristionchus entomophagus]
IRLYLERAYTWDIASFIFDQQQFTPSQRNPVGQIPAMHSPIICSFGQSDLFLLVTATHSLLTHWNPGGHAPEMHAAMDPVLSDSPARDETRRQATKSVVNIFFLNICVVKGFGIQNIPLN